MLDYSYLYRSASIAYAESIEKLRDNFVEVNPHCFGAVPRVYEKDQARILDQVATAPATRRKLFAWAVGIGREKLEREERGEPLACRLEWKGKDAEQLV